ncbi:MAG: isopropylmalate isomerase [Synechococcus sp.]|nr:isopropylmalate isomerase [Synechococcus sp.]
MASTPRPFPFGAIRSLRGTAVALRGDDIDTDRIIPARFLRCVTFEALGPAVFADDRAEQAGAAAGPHPFDRAEHRQASLLVVNRNFGCGSSREHAPQALMRWGIRALIGESFSEIFFGNCLALGIPCLSATHDTILALQQWVETQPHQPLDLDLPSLQLRVAAGEAGEAGEAGTATWSLRLAAGPHTMLLSGQWDATGQLLDREAELAATAARLPYLHDFAPAI